MNASAGTYESSDCIINISDANQKTIHIESIVFEQFGDQINHVINEVLKKYKIDTIKVECFDKGALDYTIKSRLETALQRGGYIE